MKTLFPRFPLMSLAASLLAVDVVLARADSLRDEVLSKYPLLNDSDIKPFLSEYETQCRPIDEEAHRELASLPKVEWTGEDAELFWSGIAETASRTSTAPRWNDADSQSGEGLLETFGTRYMPNTYATYQEVRAAAKERELLLAENFPDGRASDATGGPLYDKVSKACVKTVAEMFRRHDELCHFYLLNRTGAVTDGALAELDREKLKVVLPEIGVPPAEYSRTIAEPSAPERDFAQKYLPETWAGYQRLETAFADGVKNYAEWRHDAILADAVRSEMLLRPVRNTLDGIGSQSGGIVQFVKEQKLLHAVGEATAAQLAEVDKRRADGIRGFEKTAALPASVKSAAETIERRLKDKRLAEKQRDHDGRVEAICSKAARGRASARQTILDKCVRLSASKAVREILLGMIQIPGRNYLMGKCEVTQAQWEAVTGNNPSEFQGANNPVENVSWYDCGEFLRKLNALPAVKESCLVFRLPTDAEWEYASRAGSKAIEDVDTLVAWADRVAWDKENSGGKTHPVGQKEPNAFGLYDTRGNVWEWCQERYDQVVGGCTEYTRCTQERGRVVRGGSWENSIWFMSDDDRAWSPPTARDNNTGFRLCAEKTREKAEAERKAREGESRIAQEKAEAERRVREEAIARRFISQLVHIPGKNYSMGKYEVTQSQWVAVMGENPSRNKGADKPVDSVSWNDCQEFLNKLNEFQGIKESGFVFRLPEKDEWEYACRAGAKEKYCKLFDGTEITKRTLRRVAWYKDNSDRRSHPVGQKEPNAFGLYDMLGNVSEFCQTEHQSIMGTVHIVRGGDWREPPKDCEASKDAIDISSVLADGRGFRLCAEKR